MANTSLLQVRTSSEDKGKGTGGDFYVIIIFTKDN